MKHIIKGDEPREFADWKALGSEDWQPGYSDFSGAAKEAVKNALMMEQGYICCYCERRLTSDDSHIEHFKPQSDPAVDPLDFSNMLCSCQNQVKKGEPRHCGHLKDDWFDDQLLVSPFNPNCESRFAFTADGGIQPGNQADHGARTTIDRLGLGIPKVNALRRMAIEPFLEDNLDEAELKHFVAGYLKKDSQGRFGEFWATINHLFHAYA
jgi:uncharacterized protein (TIGR02646 family)